MQYKIRKSMKESQAELPRIGVNKGVLKNPTTNFLIEALNKTALVREASGGYAYRLYNEYIALSVKTFFKLLEVDMDDPF